MPKTVVNILGMKFGRCSVVAFAGVSNGQATWECLCECGKRFTARGGSLRGGNTKSCGCLQAEVRANSNKTHGKSKTPEHRIWTNMKTRCTNTKNKSYPNYGGRGIKICDEWMNFENFLSDMGPRPDEDSSLERIDVNGDYCPDNCRWASHSEQQNNRRNNHRITIGNETKTKASWCRAAGISRSCLDSRISRGLSGEDLIRPTGRVDPTTLPVSTFVQQT